MFALSEQCYFIKSYRDTLNLDILVCYMHNFKVKFNYYINGRWKLNEWDTSKYFHDCIFYNEATSSIKVLNMFPLFRN